MALTAVQRTPPTLHQLLGLLPTSRLCLVAVVILPPHLLQSYLGILTCVLDGRGISSSTTNPLDTPSTTPATANLQAPSGSPRSPLIVVTMILTNSLASHSPQLTAPALQSLQPAALTEYSVMMARYLTQEWWEEPRPRVLE